MASITLEINTDVANAFQLSEPEEQQKIQVLINKWMKQAINISKLQTTMDKLSDEAEASVPRQVLDKCLINEKILMCYDTLTEVNELFGRSKKFDKYLSSFLRIEFLKNLTDSVEMIEITTKIDLCRDPKDNKFLELVVSGKANYLISGDQDLLILNPFKEISIITPTEFMNIYLLF